MEVSCLLFSWDYVWVTISSKVQIFRQWGPREYLYIPNPMKVNGDSEILALQSPGPFPTREEYKTSIATLLWL